MAEKVARKTVTLDRGDNTSCTIDLFGGQIVSWKMSGEEQFFFAGNTTFDNKTPMRGGIPVIFPKFANWDDNKPFHGFARISFWTVEQSPVKMENGDVRARIQLTDSDYTRSIWNHSFALSLDVVLKSSSLEIAVVLRNTGQSPFNFELLLHTYFKVPDVSTIQLIGFEGLNYIDKTQNDRESTEKRSVLTFDKSTGAIFKNAPETCIISDANSGKKMRLVSKHFGDAVIWNPWAELAKNIPELKEGEYRNFICVEPGLVTKPVNLPAGQTFEASQLMEILQ